jgi:hypothetical protein
VGSENEGEGETRRNVPPTPHPTSVSAESTFSALPSHRFLDASRRYPVWEVVDFWEGPIPGRGSIEETSATEERWAWVGRGGSADYSERTEKGRTYIPTQQRLRPFPPPSPSVPTLASRTEGGGPEMYCVVLCTSEQHPRANVTRVNERMDPGKRTLTLCRCSIVRLYSRTLRQAPASPFPEGFGVRKSLP